MAQDELLPQEERKLKRSMGLVAAISIGVGTMVGAGIFVFPGLAGGYAGPAAVLSFAIGGFIALLVALCTAELATAMPESGGGYFYISRSFGSFWGIISGVSQWLGLVFASAFYLAGFADYSLELMHEFNLNVKSFVIAVGAALILLGVNLLGSKKVGRLQNFAVILLTSLLLVVFIYGLIDITGIIGENRVFTGFAPNGYTTVFTTTALIFTSYLGFVQISTVAGEIKNPDKNLPRALIISVLIVVVLYLFVLFISTSLFSATELRDFGETATLEVARKLLGNGGAIVVLIAGILATLSSANASIMSSSRSVFALAKDRLVPKKAGALSQKYNAPHIALLLVVIPVVSMLFLGNLEFFAEVASFLHLVMYGGICITLLKIRRTKAKWYKPSFRLYKGQVVASIGAFCCLALIFFMDKKSILTGLVVIVLTSVYYYLFHRDKEIPKPKVDD